MWRMRMSLGSTLCLREDVTLLWVSVRVTSTSTGCLGKGRRKTFSKLFFAREASSVACHSWKSVLKEWR